MAQTAKSPYRPSSRVGSHSVQPRKKAQAYTEVVNAAPVVSAYLKPECNIKQVNKYEIDNRLPPCVIVCSFFPPSVRMLQHLIKKAEESIKGIKSDQTVSIAGKKKMDVKNMTNSQSDQNIRKSKRFDDNGTEYINPTINLKDHPINIVLRNSNQFLSETFLRHGDKKPDLKKVQ
jgi:hypothetical protein